MSIRMLVTYVRLLLFIVPMSLHTYHYFQRNFELKVTIVTTRGYLP